MNVKSKKPNLVVLSGAGVSAESGLKTFRDADGLWNGYSVYEVATPGAWRKNPSLVTEFYNSRRREVANAQPNLAHQVLAELQQQWEVHIITQNIDDLHERAGSSNVHHLHGKIFEMRSEKDPDRIYPIHSDIAPLARAEDGGLLRPNIVWFEEEVPMIVPAVHLVNQADVFLVIGTSLQVYPAAGLIDYLQPNTPSFLIDKKIPDHGNLKNFHTIEASATEGILEFKNLLQQLLP